MSNHMIETRELSSLANQLGADLFGVADLRSVRDYVIQQARESLGEFSHAVVVGMRLSNTVVDQLDPLAPVDYSV